MKKLFFHLLMRKNPSMYLSHKSVMNLKVEDMLIWNSDCNFEVGDIYRKCPVNKQMHYKEYKIMITNFRNLSEWEKHKVISHQLILRGYFLLHVNLFSESTNAYLESFCKQYVGHLPPRVIEDICNFFSSEYHMREEYMTLDEKKFSKFKNILWI